MPFSWYRSQIPDWFEDTFDRKNQNQVEDRIRTQARILRNLNYSLEDAICRVRLYLQWEFELPRGSAIPCWEQVEELVTQVYEMTIKYTERGFPDPDTVRDHIRKVYLSKILDAGAC
ncbi:MAG: hypothetical protein JW797_08155 [Bradymonadales bacterium]|nr:hypothetical protein [Bradymonadales bacterium]